MAKYIDVESLVIGYSGYTPDDEFSKGVDFVLDLLDSKPPEDVRPVVKGKWINTDAFDKESNVKCSECETEFDYIDGVCYLCAGHRLPNFCPNCGADMRGCECE